MNTLSLTISSTPIHQDIEGRYCLNDLHKASGGEKRHGPSYWLEAQSTKEIIQELTDTGNPVSVIKGGLQQGTYVVKELVYSYAMWISPSFSLKVIRAYDSLVTGQPQPTFPNRDYEILQNKYIALLEQDNARMRATAMPYSPAYSPAVSGGHRPWTPAQDQELLALQAEGYGWTAIGVKVGRSRENCRYRYNKLQAQQGGAA